MGDTSIFGWSVLVGDTSIFGWSVWVGDTSIFGWSVGLDAVGTSLVCVKLYAEPSGDGLVVTEWAVGSNVVGSTGVVLPAVAGEEAV